MAQGFGLARKRNPILLWWKGLDKPLLTIFMFWIAVGLVAATSASPAVADTYSVGPFYFAIKHAIFIVMSLGLVFGLSFLRFPNLLRASFLFYVLSLLGIVFVLLIGKDVKGASRWVEVFGFTVQPSEMLKVTFPVIVAVLMAQATKNKAFGMGAFVTIVLLLIQAALLLLQPDFGMTVMVGFGWFVALYLSGLSHRLALLMVGSGPLVLVFGYFMLPHVRNRLETYINPASGDMYQVSKAEEALLSGGLWGKGMGEGVVKDVVPDAHTDFIFTVLAEELGLVFCSVLLLSYAYWVVRASTKLLDVQNRTAQVMGYSLLALFSMQVLVNISVVMHLIPTTGMTLPFVSYGGTATIAMAFLVGVILSLTRKDFSHNVSTRKRY